MSFKDMTVKERADFTCKDIQKRRTAKARAKENDYIGCKAGVIGRAQKKINHRKQGGVFY